ncbi:MAG: malate dehydrogenase [Thermoproteota archaeon]|nr:malate dehydrogenase [Thermoproteota archaeon]
MKIHAYEKDDDVSGADLIVVCAGQARMPGASISRRDLVVENAKIIREVATVVPSKNHSAKFIIVSNPVDAMATLFKKVSRVDFVIGTGDQPDTMRFRTKLSTELGVPVSEIEGFVGGEHGSAAYALWSTVRITNAPLEDYLKVTGKTLDRSAVVDYVRKISMEIVEAIGATEYGPAAAFRDIIRSIVQDRGEIYSIAVASKLPGLPEAVNVSIPTSLGQRIGPNIWKDLTVEEQKNIIEAAKIIYKNYLTGY